MKKILCTILIAILILSLGAGLFACKEKEEPSAGSISLDVLATETVTSVLPEEPDPAPVVAALLSLFTDAGLEDAETHDALLALQKKGKEIGPALLALRDRTFTSEQSSIYQSALQAIAEAIGPEAAGSLFYTAATKVKSDLPYTLSDCKKIASLLLGQDAAFGSDLLDELKNGEYSVTRERQLNTVLLSLSASLRKAIGISESAKNYLYELATAGARDYSFNELSKEDRAVLEAAKALSEAVLITLRDGYDAILSFTASYLSYAGARLFLGAPYEKKEIVLYYLYDWDNWSKTEIDKQIYDAHADDPGHYLALEETVKGFTTADGFLIVKEEDVLLAERAHKLYAAYRAYSALSEKEKTDIVAAVDTFLTALGHEQGTVAALLNRKIIEDDGTPGASFEEMITALPALSAIDVTDGISDAERASAKTAVGLFERYLHGYLPQIY